jgi:hypothetical protein
VKVVFDTNVYVAEALLGRFHFDKVKKRTVRVTFSSVWRRLARKAARASWSANAKKS